MRFSSYALGTMFAIAVLIFALATIASRQDASAAVIGPLQCVTNLSCSAAPASRSLAEPAQYSSCSGCRRFCINDFRVRCGYAQSCRKEFVRCMRFCWRDYCR